MHDSPFLTSYSLLEINFSPPTLQQFEFCVNASLKVNFQLTKPRLKVYKITRCRQEDYSQKEKLQIACQHNTFIQRFDKSSLETPSAQ